MIGRIEEKRQLQQLLTADEAQFVAVFGRRRIGKTFLIRESFDYKFTFQHTGLSNNSIKTTGAFYLSKGKFNSLKSLNLNYDEIGDEGLHHISNGFFIKLNS